MFWAIDGDRLVRISRGALTARRLPEAVAGRVSNRIEEDATGTIWLTLTDHRYAHLAGGESLRVLKIFPAGVTNDEQRPARS